MILGQTSGIDKAYRFLIYFLRIVAVLTVKRSGKVDHPLVVSIARFTGPLADTRMVLRLFGLLPMFQGIVWVQVEDVSNHVV